MLAKAGIFAEIKDVGFAFPVKSNSYINEKNEVWAKFKYGAPTTKIY
jgi:hypothetical protein